jgi:hypothetical protein
MAPRPKQRRSLNSLDDLEALRTQVIQMYESRNKGKKFIISTDKDSPHYKWLQDDIKKVVGDTLSPSALEDFFNNDLKLNFHVLTLDIFEKYIASIQPSPDTFGFSQQRQVLHDSIENKLLKHYQQTESKLKIETILNAVNIEGRLGVIENTIELLTSCGDVVKESVYPMLFKFGYPLPRLPYSLENLAKVLKIFIGHYKLESHKYSILKNQTTDESENKDEYSWDSFQSILTTISLTMKMPPIDIQQITTGQFCTYVSQFNNYVKQQQKNAK